MSAATGGEGASGASTAAGGAAGCGDGGGAVAAPTADGRDAAGASTDEAGAAAALAGTAALGGAMALDCMPSMLRRSRMPPPPRDACFPAMIPPYPRRAFAILPNEHPTAWFVGLRHSAHTFLISYPPAE